MRHVQDLEKEFPEVCEVKAFVNTLAPLLSTAMNLRTQPLSDAQFYAKAAEIKAQILEAVNQPAHHFGIQRIQDIFRDNTKRLYHWAKDRRVPADNNLAERDLRPTVIARKVSFGSQSDAGARTRSILMTVLHALRKHGFDPTTQLKNVLDKLAQDIAQDPFPFLFARESPPSLKGYSFPNIRPCWQARTYDTAPSSEFVTLRRYLLPSVLGRRSMLDASSEWT